MAALKERKIHFCTLLKREWSTKIEEPYFIIGDVVKYINSLSKKAKMFPLKESKVCLLQSAITTKTESNAVLIKGFFKSARHSFSPNLINTDTGDERPSPKLLKEGILKKLIL